MGKVEWRVAHLGLGGFAKSSQGCIIDVDVDEDKVIRTRPLVYRGDANVGEYVPWTIEARGGVYEAPRKVCVPPLCLTYAKRTTSQNRIPYPLKRVDWDPNGERNPQNRGISKYERISWDEATDIIASEIKRVTETYGPYAILAQGDGHGESKLINSAHGNQMNLLHKYNGAFLFQARNPDSWEGWYWGARHLWGMGLGQPTNGNTLLDIAENSDTLLHWGCDLETTPWGWGDLMGSSYTFFLTEIGVRQIFISPDMNYSAACHADRWIPVYANTDAALQLAIIYVWLTENLWDEEYVKTHAVGMDWIQYYVMGGEDGVAKTPKWAEEKCGVPSRVIKALARHWAKHNVSIAHVNGGSFIRSCFSTEPGRLEGVLMGMQGFGKPGRNVTKFIEWRGFGLESFNPAPAKKRYPDISSGYSALDYNDPTTYDIRDAFIPKTLVAQALKKDFTKDEPLEWFGVGLAGWPTSENFLHYSYPNEVANYDFHMVWSDTPCWTTCWNDGNDFIEGIRNPKIETFVVQHPWMENDCLLADILLPICTVLEVNDLAGNYENGEQSILAISEACVNRVGEAKSDWEAVGEVARKLGCYEKYAWQGQTIEERLESAFEGTGWSDVISFEELKEVKYIGFGEVEDWKDAPRGMELFCKDPEANPLDTPSGKLKFYSSAIATQWPDDKERGPYPKWIEETDRHHERLTSDRAKDYPYLIISNHPRWRVHANMDDVAWLREIPTCKVTGPDGYQYEPVWINPVDAAELGVVDGDVVKLYNERGWVLGGVIVTPRIAVHNVLQDHGARRDAICDKGDRGGANNTIAPSECCSENAPGEVTSGFLVGVEKVDVFELAAQYPEAFGKKIHDGVGVCIDSYLA